jgi:uncharacterized protein
MNSPAVTDPGAPQEAPSERTRVRRVPQRASYDRALIDAVLDEAFICHLGLVADGVPFVIPTVHWRLGDELFIHGASVSRLIEHGRSDAECCVTVTLLDGIVLARSAFHHSLNYRSVVILGRARAVVDGPEKLAALTALVDRFAPGRSGTVRAPNAAELKATTVLAIPLSEASAKVRSGGPLDDREDASWPVWAGVIPLRLEAQPAQQALPGVPQATPKLGFPLDAVLRQPLSDEA